MQDLWHVPKFNCLSLACQQLHHKMDKNRGNSRYWYMSFVDDSARSIASEYGVMGRLWVSLMQDQCDSHECPPRSNAQDPMIQYRSARNEIALIAQLPMLTLSIGRGAERMSFFENYSFVSHCVLCASQQYTFLHRCSPPTTLAKCDPEMPKRSTSPASIFAASDVQPGDANLVACRRKTMPHNSHARCSPLL
jgi:hypothetical protein